MKKKNVTQLLLQREATINNKVVVRRKPGVKRYYDNIHTEPDVKKICRSLIIGLTEDEVCFQHRISKQLYHRLALDPVVKKAIELGQSQACRRLKNALIKKGLGYDLIEETKEPKTVALIKTKSGYKPKRKLVVTKTVTKHLPPDTSAINSYLRNYDPTWKGESPQAVGQQQNNNYFPQPVTPEQIDADIEKRCETNSATLQRYGTPAPGTVEV